MMGWLKRRRERARRAAEPVDWSDEEGVRQRVERSLSEVEDPELGLDVLSLGLIRQIGVRGGDVHVRMTLTSPSCPVGPWMRQQVGAAVLRALPGLERVEVVVEAEPPWSPDEMSCEARDALRLGSP